MTPGQWFGIACMAFGVGAFLGMFFGTWLGYNHALRKVYQLFDEEILARDKPQ